MSNPFEILFVFLLVQFQFHPPNIGSAWKLQFVWDHVIIEDDLLVPLMEDIY